MMTSEVYHSYFKYLMWQ